mmetsp:Transcript_2780/g.17293  ORF Transcript_2780/g.17293 Transcript_2780/m.17293 type:complete len:209 (-) Transcript_2780:288-914(-)
MQCHDAESRHDHNGHHSFQLAGPCICGSQSRSFVGTVCKPLEYPSCHGLSYVGTNSEQRIYHPCLIHVGGFVGQSPEQQRQHDISPQFAEDVEEGVCPVLDHGDPAFQSRREDSQPGFRVGMQYVLEGKQQRSEEPEEGHERHEGCVEERSRFQSVRQFRVHHEEQQGAREHRVDGEERQLFRTSERRDHQGVFGAVQDGVDEGHEEE